MSPKSIEFDLIPRMVSKLNNNSKREIKFRIIAAAFTKRGNFLGFETNGFREGLSNRKGAGKHAEAALIRKFGKKIDTIFILRIGKGNTVLPIHPCENCAKIAAKLNIKIVPLHEELEIC